MQFLKHRKIQGGTHFKFLTFIWTAVLTNRNLRLLLSYQCGGSGMFIRDPLFFPSWIQDAKSKNLSILTQKIISTLSEI